MRIGERVNVSRWRNAATYYAFLRRERGVEHEPLSAVFVPDKAEGKRGLIQGKVYVLRKKGV